MSEPKKLSDWLPNFWKSIKKQPDPLTGVNYADITLIKPIRDRVTNHDLLDAYTKQMAEVMSQKINAYQPPPRPIIVEMPLDQFSEMPCKSAGELITALKMRERLKGTDLDKYDRMTIEIRDGKVEVTFAASQAVRGQSVYGYRVTAQEMAARMAAADTQARIDLEKVRIEAYKNMVESNRAMSVPGPAKVTIGPDGNITIRTKGGDK